MSTEGPDPVDPVDVESGSSHVEGAEAPGKKRKRRHLPVWQETLLLLAIALVLAIVVKAFFLQAFYIPTGSMEPGLIKNDRILVEKPSYWFGDGPERGDVVVFKDPGDWLPASADSTTGLQGLLARVGLYPTGGHLVKRVIGVGGDVITCCDDEGRLVVNGQPLDEASYAELDGAECYGPMPTGKARCDWEVGPIPDGKLFVMGDNRSHSADSSFHACLGVEGCRDEPYVDVDGVVGRVFALLWPIGRATLLDRPGTFDDVPDAES